MSESAQEAEQLLVAARAGSREALGKPFETCRNYLLLVAGRQIEPRAARRALAAVTGWAWAAGSTTWGRSLLTASL
jgi:hypothetical protein